jgi:PHD/YefM family antitoxin component YafN of YafNO toxin-antitoxin module
MKTLKLSEASRPLSEYASALTDDIVVVTERNRPLAAVVSLRNVDREVLALSGSPRFLEIIEQSRRDFAAGQSRPLADVRKQFGVRRSNRKRVRQTRKKRARG